MAGSRGFRTRTTSRRMTAVAGSSSAAAIARYGAGNRSSGEVGRRDSLSPSSVGVRSVLRTGASSRSGQPRTRACRRCRTAYCALARRQTRRWRAPLRDHPPSVAIPPRTSFTSGLTAGPPPPPRSSPSSHRVDDDGGIAARSRRRWASGGPSVLHTRWPPPRRWFRDRTMTRCRLFR